MSYPPPHQQPHYPPAQEVHVVVRAAKPVNHALHAILTVCTCGLWLPVWVIVAIAGRRR